MRKNDLPKGCCNVAHQEITQIQRFIGDGGDMPTEKVLPGSLYYKVTDANTIVEKYIFSSVPGIRKKLRKIEGD